MARGEHPSTTGSWPAHTTERLSWRQSTRGGTRADRMLDHVEAGIPPFIADLDHSPSPGTTTAIERAAAAVATAEAEVVGGLSALGQFLIRTESVASSKIEHEDADALAFARAIAGSRANSSATLMVAASEALTRFVEEAGATGRIDESQILGAHAALFADDPHERRYAGRYRDVQNWIGGSDHSPRNALFVPPAPARVPDLMRDLVDYANRDDLPALVQAAAAHAQFESIHPFTDGNGRIGRALVNAILRRRGLTARSVVPVAGAMLADRDGYFALLDGYRTGDLDAFVHRMAVSVEVAAREARTSAARIDVLPAEWSAMVGARSGSAAQKLIGVLAEHPVFSGDLAARLIGSPAPNTNRAIETLETAGIVREITGRKRDRVWVSVDLLGELDDLQERIAAALPPLAAS
ncbi:Fic family protein [Agromyces sp. LHK192]|uniref:Fic family protein n=1 Tax=Agromyces sp. LHK192 TaxID=2498704 RepID=UPI00272D02DF|nr:Fic family protein [Agromyces sp. LHK192]